MKTDPELVYSTNKNLQPCAKCDKLNCTCPPEKNVSSNKQTIRISLDRKARRGKSVTLVEGFQVNPTHLADIAKSLKQFLGTGGTAKQGRIEIQGDHRKKVAERLAEMGYKVKLVGG
jgi:translation initiation factor 1